MKTGTAESYRVVRLYRDGGRKQVLARRLTLEEAQAWCSDPNGSSSTCWKTTPMQRTKRRGPWLEAFERE